MSLTTRKLTLSARVARISSRKAGFTVIELLVVIVILCILVSLIAITASGVQAKNRNGARQTQIDTIRGQLESFYAQTNTYPTFAQINSSQWRAKNLKRLKQTALAAPHWNKNTAACTSGDNAIMASQPTANCLSYQVTGLDGSP